MLRASESQRPGPLQAFRAHRRPRLPAQQAAGGIGHLAGGNKAPASLQVEKP